MIFLIEEVEPKFEVIVFKPIEDLTSRVEWQDIFDGKSIIIDQNGIEYEWNENIKHEIGTVYGYTMRKTKRTSNLVKQCISMLKSD